MISDRVKAAVRDIADFPKPGIVFKDITPIFKDQKLCTAIVDEFCSRLAGVPVDVIAGIESRGFLFGMMLANRLGVPFVPIRKAGKLPYKTIRQEYLLEYGSASVEIHEDAFEKGKNVLIHDDLLATGGTVLAASKLIQQLGGVVSGYSFVINLDFLQGKEKLKAFSDSIIVIAEYA
ncbi:adenine phosphoribosyltransferase [Rubrolithibacter danxiaensis]|uniref:adenine phosphoribosyltransferase n=1 Tax=Rubrolithibacter danxiaensis TaxID=3390805 RepID=UPI003BF7848B